MSESPSATFSLDLRHPRGKDAGYGDFTHEWRARMGGEFPLPSFSPDTTGDFRFGFRATRVRDVAFTSVQGAAPARTANRASGGEDQVRMWIVRRGAWMLGGRRDGVERTVPAGGFLIQHVGQPKHFAMAPATTATVLMLPAASLTPLLGGRALSGSGRSAEVRLMIAHATMTHRTLADLSPAGTLAARNALIELTKAVVQGGIDSADTSLFPALAEAARQIADRRLTDADLSPAMLARELNVSLRTLQRAFSAAGESVSGYIRGRRLEEARLALGRMSVSEAAAHWQFADSSHFTRAFKRHYGLTPSQDIRPSGS